MTVGVKREPFRDIAYTCKQLIMGARFHNLAMIHHMDDIGTHGSSKAMRDDQCGATLDKCSEAIQPFSLGPRIHKAGWLIQDDNR